MKLHKISVNEHPVCDDNYFEEHGFQYVHQPVELVSMNLECYYNLFSSCKRLKKITSPSSS